MEMKKNLLSWFILLTMNCLVFDASAEIYLTHSSDEINSGLTNSSLTATVSASVAFTPDYYQEYSKFSIKSLEFGLYDISKLKTIKFWVRHHLTDAVCLFESNVDISLLSNGWNCITLDTPIDLSKQTDTLFFGFDYTQSVKNSKVIGVGGIKCSGGFFVGANGKWKDYSATSAPLSMRGVLVGTNPYDIAIRQVQISPRTQFIDEPKKPQKLRISGQVVNYGSEPVTSFNVRCKSPNDWEKTITVVCNMASCEYCDFNIETYPPVIKVSDYPVQIEIFLPNEDADSSNNTAVVYYDALCLEDSGFQRTGMLLESYTSLNNGFSALAQSQLYVRILPSSPIMLGVPYSTFIYMTQHRGFGPVDRLSVLENNPYSARAIFGKGELQYAPALSIDHRQVLSLSTLDPDTIADYVTKAYKERPYQACQMSGKALYNDSSITVEIKVESKVFSWTIDPVLVVCLVQNEVDVPDQKNYYDFSFKTENNVVTKFLTPKDGYSLKGVNGKRLTAEERDEIASGRRMSDNTGGSVTVSLNCKLSDDFNPSDYHIVAYVCEMDLESQAVDAVISLDIHTEYDQ